MSSAASPAPAPSSAGPRAPALVRVEDAVLALWVVLALPVLARVGQDGSPFDGAQPAEGMFRLGAVLAALACLAARRPAGQSAGGSIVTSAAIGPLSGGILLVAISGGIAAGLTSPEVMGFAALGAAVVAAMRLVVPAVPAAGRRALMTPFVLAAGGIFWSLIDAVAPAIVPDIRGTSGLDAASARTAFAFLLAFSGVYYAMLVYAPRQLADREGTLVSWLVRYGTFVVGVLLGVGWLRALGT